MYDEQYYEKCLLIDGRSVCCGFAVSKNVISLDMNIKYSMRNIYYYGILSDTLYVI